MSLAQQILDIATGRELAILRRVRQGVELTDKERWIVKRLRQRAAETPEMVAARKAAVQARIREVNSSTTLPREEKDLGVRPSTKSIYNRPPERQQRGGAGRGGSAAKGGGKKQTGAGYASKSQARIARQSDRKVQPKVRQNG